MFCEKPPGRNLQDVLEVIEVEKSHSGQYLKYGFNHRYHGSVKKALELIKTERFGKVSNLRGVYRKSKVITFAGGWRAEREYAGGGILLDQGIHMLDLMNLFLGGFCEVKSYVSNSYWNHDVEDNAYALMKDSQGRIAMLHSSATQWQHKFHLEIGLTEGFIDLQGILSGTKSYGEEKLVYGPREEAHVGFVNQKEMRFLEDHSWRDEIEEFVDAIENEGQILNGTSNDALESIKLVCMIYNSDEQWKKKFNIADIE